MNSKTEIILSPALEYGLAVDAVMNVWGLTYQQAIDDYSAEIAKVQRFAHSIAEYNGTTWREEIVFAAELVEAYAS